MTHVSPVLRHTRTLSLFLSHSLSHTLSHFLSSPIKLLRVVYQSTEYAPLCLFVSCPLHSMFQHFALFTLRISSLSLANTATLFSVPRISDTPRRAGFVSVAERVKYLSMVIYLQGPPTSFVSLHIHHNDFKDFNAKDLKRRF